MTRKYNDTDLREALHRKYANTPELPSDFMAKMEQRMDSVPNGSPVAKRHHLSRWLAVAACLLLIVGIGLMLLPEVEQQRKPMLAKNITQPKVVEEPVAKVTPAQEQIPQTKVVEVKKITKRSVKADERTDVTPTNRVEPVIMNSNLHYASNELTKDTLTYQNPARVDEFIAKMAAYNNVKQGELECTQPAGSDVVSSVYVFPDNKEIDVFGRLLQVACCYSDETPGYLLSFSHQQFFFELKDMRQQLQYRWIAERVGGKILLYGTHAPLGTKESSACYQEYRDELMHIKSINQNPREI